MFWKFGKVNWCFWPQSSVTLNLIIIISLYLDMKGKLWSVFRVSDLNNFHYNRPTTFARYGRLLSRHLVESFTEAVTLKATFMIKPDIQGLEAEDPPVYIKVEDIQLTQPKLVYEGTH